MIERLEVVPGPGTVVRYGNVVAWAAASASSSLVSFLSESARNLAPSSVGGDQLADHLVGVLSRRDPEPHVPFIAVGPSEEGWTALLHGPVQVWDGTHWIVPSQAPGWLRSRLWPRPALTVSASGATVPPPSPDSIWDLEAGVVPGGGFILLAADRTSSSAPQPFAVTPEPAEVAAPAPVPSPVEETTVLAVSDSGPDTVVLPFDDVEPAQPESETEAETADGAPDSEPAGEEPELPAGVAALGLPPAEEVAELPAGDSSTEEPERTGDGANAAPAAAAGLGAAALTGAGLATEGPSAKTSGPAPAGVVDLRSAEVRSRVVAYPPLPPAGGPSRPVPGAPVVAGVPCPRGHLNRPGMATCARCGRGIAADSPGYQVSGTRPALGCLIADDGSVYRLDSAYLLGADPARDPTVRGRLARPLVLGGEDVAPSHAEIRLHDWDVLVTDRASEGGTHIFPPGAASWERIRPYDPRVLASGTHLAFGQRVVTFVTPWIPHGDAGTGE